MVSGNGQKVTGAVDDIEVAAAEAVLVEMEAGFAIGSGDQIKMQLYSDASCKTGDVTATGDEERWQLLSFWAAEANGALHAGCAVSQPRSATAVQPQSHRQGSGKSTVQSASAFQRAG